MSQTEASGQQVLVGSHTVGGVQSDARPHLPLQPSDLVTQGASVWCRGELWMYDL